MVALAALTAEVFVFERCSGLPGRAAATSVEQLERIGRDLRDGIANVAHLQPRVTINDRVYFEQSSPISELALVDQRIEVEHEFLHSWAGSTKKLRLHGTYTAKAGFDLREPFDVTVAANETTVRVPHARILDVEQNSVEVQAYENGFWNPISGADIEAQLALLTHLARDRANELHLTQQAEQNLQTQLEARLRDRAPFHLVFYGKNGAG